MSGAVPSLDQWRAMSAEERELARLDAAAASIEGDIAEAEANAFPDFVPVHSRAGARRSARHFYSSRLLKQIAAESSLPLVDVVRFYEALERVITADIHRGAVVTLPGIVTLDPRGGGRSSAPDVIVADELWLGSTD